MQRKPKYRLLGEQKLRAEQLLHQQLFVIGRDIESKHGNLMVLYGCVRRPSTSQLIPSYYSYRFSEKRQIAFRNFGILISDDELGGIFVDRKNFEPRLFRSKKMEKIPWVPRLVPPTRAPRSLEDRVTTGCLLRQLVEWFYDYEGWIMANYGRRFRAGQLVRFRMRKNSEIWKWDMRDGWHTILDWLDNKNQDRRQSCSESPAQASVTAQSWKI